MSDFRTQRARMIAEDVEGRGIKDPAVIRALREVPREDFVPEALAEFAYEDAPLPIGEGQTISQPYVVALTLEALQLPAEARVLEIGTGSGYSAALTSRLARDVYTIERVGALAKSATERLVRLGYHNVHVRHGDGTLGWREHAPFDAIAVAAGGPSVPKALLEQLAIGGKLVMPVGSEDEGQILMRVTRTGPNEYEHESLGDVCFVPLIGAQGWAERLPRAASPRVARGGGVATLLREAGERLDDIDDAEIGAIVERIGEASVVLLGESTHGTSEFYRLRARITRELVLRRGFRFVAVEADWPDAARVCDYVLGRPPRGEGAPFTRFPAWMWRNRDALRMIEWLRAHNAERGASVGFHGLDMYSMFASMAAVLRYLGSIDPAAAAVARHRYGSLTPWQKDPSAYGRAVREGHYQSSEGAVVAMLRDLLASRVDYERSDGDRWFSAAQNARVVASAEKYYRAMYYASADSWNMRDAHMFDTLRALLAFYGEGAKAIVWAHNTHVGDARATEPGRRGEVDLGQLCRTTFGDDAYAIGFGTDHGTVAAARGWDEEAETMRVRPAHVSSYERLFHDSGVPALTVFLRDPVRRAVREELMVERLERAIGVVYAPQTELESHYFQACLPRQFDEWIWVDETHAVEALPVRPSETAEMPETYPFGL